MEDTKQADICFPKDLIEWAGHHAGGVKRLFDDLSGRPSRDLLRTNLISKLEAWAADVASGEPDVPRILLLVGGPGNGKTEAIEHTIKCLEQGLSAEGRLLAELSMCFHPPAGQAVSRVVRVNAGRLAAIPKELELEIVQDASVTAGHEGRSAPILLIEELQALLAGPKSRFYLCCVNRGVLDDALIHAIDNDLANARTLLELITRAVSLSSDAPSCWPLKDQQSIAIWPMDAESLLITPEGQTSSPAAKLLEHATKPEYWPAPDGCAAGSNCPFCHSQTVLGRQEHQAALLQILRWYELASGKRWSFRDLFSLMSYVLAGHYQSAQGQHADPCHRAAHLIALDKAGKVAKRPSRQELTAPFHLATSSYQHAIFHRWDKNVATALRQDIRDLDLGSGEEEGRTLLGLQHFLSERKEPYLPATIATLLDSLAELLDPALASPDGEVAVSARSRIMLGDLDTRFSRSLSGGIEFIRKYQVLSGNELELLRRLAKADSLLSSPAVRRRKPTAASRTQRALRDFACRLVRRSICVRSAVVADAAILKIFQQVVEDEAGGHLFEVAQQVKKLLNGPQGFEVSLTTTFGQPLPPAQRQAILVVPAQHVKPLPVSMEGRPRSPICFLRVGSGQSSQPIALTYDLFKAVKELERGLSPASLPRTVVALLDTTRARLSGPIVRDTDIIEEARIKIGADGVAVGLSFNGFASFREEGRR